MLRDEVVWALLFLSGVAGVRLTIKQMPPRVTVTEGGSVQLNCSLFWNLTQKEEKLLYTINWYKDEESALLCNTTAAYNGRLLKGYTKGFPWEWASITIHDLKLNETGKYYCRIQIFKAETAFGSGTEITVKRVAGVGLTIKQSPPRVTVTEGGSVDLNCSLFWNLTQKEEKLPYTIDWYKDEESALLCNTTAAYNGRLLRSYTKGFPWEWASITIHDLKLNDTGKYYCRIQINNAETAFGTGTEVTVKRKKNVPLPGLFALPAAVLTMAIALVIYILRRRRSPAKRSGSQVVSREVAKSQAVLYTNLNNRKMKSLHPTDQIDHKSVKPGIRHKEPKVTGSISLAESEEGGVLYSQLRFQDHCEEHLPSKPVKTPRMKEEYVVYGAVSEQQL